MTNNTKSVMIKNSEISYIDQGGGEPIVFLHGAAASCHLWSEVINILSDKARCLAPDLIAMSNTDNPESKYGFFEHVEYVSEFIDKLNLHNVTLVLHGLLGSAIGFHYAMHNKDNIKGIAFYEAYVRPAANFTDLSLPVQQVVHSLRKKSDLENFEQANKSLWQAIQDFFVGENCKKMVDHVVEYSNYLTQSLFPKLMLYTVPGVFVTMDTVKWCKDNLSNLCLADLDEGLFLAPESNPQMFGQLLSDWYKKIQSN